MCVSRCLYPLPLSVSVLHESHVRLGVSLSFQFFLSDQVGKCTENSGGLFSSNKSIANRTSVFSLGDRATVIEQVGTEACQPHIAAENKQKFAFEALFRSMLHLLVESATTEYLFTHQFFGRMDSIFHQVSAISLSESDCLLAAAQARLLMQSC